VPLPTVIFEVILLSVRVKKEIESKNLRPKKEEKKTITIILVFARNAVRNSKIIGRTK
jgi:hypothetical protein